MAEKSNPKVSKIKKYRKPLNINVGMLIFAAIFLYICICIIMYFKDNHIKPYEVREGSITSTNLYNGIILREEKIVNTDTAGYVNYYAREGERVAVGNLVYTIDETGRLSDYVAGDKINENSLSDKDLRLMKGELSNFVHHFSQNNFADVYDLKYSLKGNILKLANTTLLNNISDWKGKDLDSVLKLSYSDDTGIVMYWTDGYEKLTEDLITKNILEKKDYEKKQLLSNELVSEQEPVYKICHNENWSVVILVDDIKARELSDAEYVNVRFVKNRKESWANVKIIHNPDGNTYAVLSFNNSMVSFTNDRFLEVELLLHDEKGLKIPNSSIVEREFYLIPENYVTQSGDSNSFGVLREAVLEDGTRSTEYVEIGIYSKVDGEYYVDSEILKSGEHLLKPDSTESFTVSKRANLIGVYNMNKGYADFKQIEILYQNEQYAIVKSNTDYGLNVYDLIVQDASVVKDEQFIYK